MMNDTWTCPDCLSPMPLAQKESHCEEHAKRIEGYSKASAPSFSPFEVLRVEIAKMTLAPGDTLVLRALDRRLTSIQYESINRCMNEFLKRYPGVNGLVLEMGMELNVIKKEDSPKGYAIGGPGLAQAVDGNGLVLGMGMAVDGRWYPGG